MNYTTLTNQILTYANRNEPAFIAAVPDLINQAMSRIYSEAKTIGFQKVTGGNMVPGTAAVLKPQDFKECISFQYTVPGPNPFSTFLLERTYEFCLTYAPNITLRGQPLFYSTDLTVPPNNVAPAQLFITPTPDINYTYQLTYLSLPPLFNAENSVNYLTDRYPSLLLYACLVEAIPFLKSDERVPVFESLYNRALQSVNNDTQNRYIDRVSKRDKD